MWPSYNGGFLPPLSGLEIKGDIVKKIVSRQVACQFKAEHQDNEWSMDQYTGENGWQRGENLRCLAIDLLFEDLAKRVSLSEGPADRRLPLRTK
jgi:hypothetical protein